MARKRLVSPEFFTHAELFDAEKSSGLPLRLAFEGLWTQADRRGLFKWRPRELKLAILPYDDVDFADVLQALVAGGFIETYEVGGKQYGRIPSFGSHQTFHPHEKPSDVPDPPSALPEPTNVRPKPAKGGPKQPVVITVTGTGTAPTAQPEAAGNGWEEAFDAAYVLMPKRHGGHNRKAALKAWIARCRTGVSCTDLHVGTERYAAHIRAAGKEGTPHVLTAETFYGPDERWKQEFDVEPPARSSGIPGVSGLIQAKAATLWPKYKAWGLLTRWPASEYARIAAERVAAGDYGTVEEFKAELQITQPWTLNGMRDDGHAINELARRLSAAGERAP